MKCILSIDGGGIRGLVPALICEHLENQLGKPIFKCFDLIAGTSTGGIIALALSAPESQRLPAKGLVKLYGEEGSAIFGQPRGPISKIYGSKYQNSSLRKRFEEIFGEATIAETQTEVFVTGYDLASRSPYYFRRKDEYRIREVALATSAAPTYFPPVKIEGKEVVDGGLVANNPALLALAEAKRIWPDEDLVLISLGAGELKETLFEKKADSWGELQWAKPVIDCMFDGSAAAVDRILRKVSDNQRYWRFQFQLTDSTKSLDCTNPRAIQELKNFATNLIKSRNADFRDILGVLANRSKSNRNCMSTRDREIDALRVDLTRHIESAANLDSDAFRKAVKRQIKTWIAAAKPWTEREIVIPAPESADFLQQMYSESTTSVFATSVPEFRKIFQNTTFSSDLMTASTKSNAITTRVFLFNHPDDISGINFRNMVGEKQHGIDVRLRFIGENENVTCTDFAIIDEKAVGESLVDPSGEVRGRWSFHPKEIEYFQQIRRDLLNGSETIDEYIVSNSVKAKVWEKQMLVGVCDDNITRYRSICVKRFGDEVAEEGAILAMVKTAGAGVYLLLRDNTGPQEYVGAFAFLPLSKLGFRRFESGNCKGSVMSTDDISSNNSSPPIAYYFATIIGEDTLAQAALLNHLDWSIRDASNRGAESVFARPITSDGLRLVKDRGFHHWSNPSMEPALEEVCRLRLT